MAINKKTTTQKLVSMPKELAEKISEYRFKNCINSEAEAIRRLISLGLSCPELPEDLNRKIDAFASHHGLSRDEAIRRLIETGLIEQIGMFDGK